MKRKRPSVSQRLLAVEGDLVMIKNWINSIGSNAAQLASNIDNGMYAYLEMKGDLDKLDEYMNQNNKDVSNEEEKPKKREEKQTKGSGATKTSSKVG